MTLIPYCVDNDWWAAQTAQVDRAAMHSAWGVEPTLPSSFSPFLCQVASMWRVGPPVDLLHVDILLPILVRNQG
jgi:hypothetical protein